MPDNMTIACKCPCCGAFPVPVEVDKEFKALQIDRDRLDALSERLTQTIEKMSAGRNGQWISYDPESGVEYHNTEEEAVAFARGGIEACNEGEWCDGVAGIFVAQIAHTTEETNVVTKDMLDAEQCYNGRHYGGGYDQWCDYELKPS